MRRVIIQRILEVFGFEMGVAALFSLFVRLELIKSTTFSNVIIAAIGIIMTLIFYGFTLHSFLMEVSNRPKVYLGVNLPIITVFVAIAIAMAVVNYEPYFTILYMPFKILAYMNLNKVLSTCVVGAIFIAQVFLMPYIGAPEPEFFEE